MAKLNATSFGRSLLVGTSATLLASLASVALGLLTNIVLARALGPEIKGQLDLMLTSSMLAMTVIGISLPSGIIYVVAGGGANLRQLAGYLLLISLGQGLAIWIVLAALSQTAYNHAFIPTAYLNWGAPALALWAVGALLLSYGRAILSGLQKYITGAVLDIAARTLLTLAALGVVVWMSADQAQAAILMIVAQIAITFVMALAALGTLWTSLHSLGATARLREIFRYSLPAYGANLAQFANYRLDVFFVAYFAGTREVGWYALAVGLAQLLWLPTNALQAVLFPRLSASSDERQKALETAQTMRVILPVTALGGGLLALGAPVLISQLLGSQYQPSLRPLWLLLPGVTVFGIANGLCGYLAAIGKPHLNLRISLLGLAVTLGLDLLLIPLWGMLGAALASSLSYAASAGLALYYFWRETHLTPVDVLWPNATDVRALAARLQLRLFRGASGEAQ